MIDRLRRLLSRPRAHAPQPAGEQRRRVNDEREDVGPRIEAARRRLKETIPPPEDPAPE